MNSRRARRVLAAAGAVAVWVPGAPGASAQTADHEALARLNEQYVVAYLHGDDERFEEILAADFRETAPDGTILDRAMFLQKMRSRPAPPAGTSVTARDVEIRVFGDMAVVHARSEVRLPDGTVRVGGRYTDIYARLDGRWRCVGAHLGGTG